MLINDSGSIIVEYREKIYTSTSKKRLKEGIKRYVNYVSYISYDLLKCLGSEEYLYFYRDIDDLIYITGVKPDNSVEWRRYKIKKQIGSINSRRFKPEETTNNKWKRMFTIPQHFFNVQDKRRVVLRLDTGQKDPFSNVNAKLNIRLEENC